MSWYFLRPQGPLLIGDGRSFGGSFYRGSIFPPPQAVFGAARARAGEALGFDWDFAAASADVRRVVGDADAPGALRVKGLFFATRAAGRPVELCFPRPADAIVFPSHRPGEKPRPPVWHPLRPARMDGVQVNAPIDFDSALAPLGHRESARKPELKPPAFVEMNPFLNLLRQPTSAPSRFAGVAGPPSDDRVHAVIENETLAAASGGLFSAGRLSFDQETGGAAEEGLAVELEGDDAAVQLEGTWRMGGKGGLVDALRAEPDAAVLDAMRQTALSAIADSDGRFRWVLVTHARFHHGWRPDFIGRSGVGVVPGTGVTVRLCAAAVGRPFAYSGWDLAARGPSRGRADGLPRPTRLLVPAGSVYFFEAVSGGASAAQRVAEAKWLERLETVDPQKASDSNDSAWRRAAAIDAACGLARGVFGPWDWHVEGEDK